MTPDPFFFFVRNNGEALAGCGGRATIDEQDLIGPHRRIRHQEIAGIVGGVPSHPAVLYSDP